MFLNLGRNGEVTLFAKTRASSSEPVSSPTEQLSEPLPADTQSNEESKKEPRLSLSGRVGTKPSFRTTRKGTLVGGFALAVHEGDKTTWHNVKAFGERAEKLKDSIKTGDAVEIVGYLHEKRVKTKAGGTRTAQEIYAVVITPH
jgi:primosomal replication protein N